MQELIRKLALTDCVKMWGERKDVPRLLQGMDALLLPSLYEGLGIVAIEAQASGIPRIEHHLPELVQGEEIPTGGTIDPGARHYLSGRHDGTHHACGRAGADDDIGPVLDHLLEETRRLLGMDVKVSILKWKT